MPRYLVERTYPDQFAIPIDLGGVPLCQTMIATMPSSKSRGCVRSSHSTNSSPFVCAMPLRRKPCGAPRSAMIYRSIASSKCACSIRISIADSAAF